MTIQLSMFGAKYDGKQADLFVAPVGQSPVTPTAPAPPAAPLLCAECGDELPPKAKACPNCYTKITKGDT